ncbi:uncharacterized protein LOC132276185 [Cornus florida]|uniref:uncharacterized protein LOC132276185 n=1 Tax=Cornus florida TaxID=4283 RepID=UPI00289F0595|nr:uncharacterized protein LOC132276185 [Cornus florida]
MASHFDRWEKDPFFSAAEEVQESADRMESTYRTWIHARKEASGMWNLEELHRDLQTALGTTKWQLEEFERAVRLSYTNSLGDDAKVRHREFITAIESQISKIETSLQESTLSTGKPPLPWARLDDRESSELALFLSGPAASVEKITTKIHIGDEQTANQQEIDKQLKPLSSKNSCNSVEWGLLEAREEKLSGHRRTASASADISAWKIAVADDVFPHSSPNGQPEVPPQRIPSFSGFLSTMETASKLKFSKNGYRKLKLPDRHQEADTTLSQSQQLTRGTNMCYERCKSCLDGVNDCYDKQLYGWYGAIQRQLQRSQYQMQYSRPIQMIVSIALLLCFAVLFVLRAI